jgi:hypothetical protein
MSLLDLSTYPLESPFYPEIYEEQRICRAQSGNVVTDIVAGDADYVKNGNIPIPANATVLSWEVVMFQEATYSVTDLRPSGLDLNVATGDWTYTLRARNIIGNLRTLQRISVLYYLDP